MAANANPNQPCPKCGATLPRADANELVPTINGRRVCEDPVACYERAGGDHNPDGGACYSFTIDLEEEDLNDRHTLAQNIRLVQRCP